MNTIVNWADNHYPFVFCYYLLLAIFCQVEPTNDRIDLEQLKVKEKIYFYEDVILYEDELADNGIAKLNVKMVIMHLSSSSLRGGGTPGCRCGNWGLCGDFAAYLCPRGGGNEGPLIY